MAAQQGWFEVDKKGLSKLVRRKGLQFILYELVQNAWDTDATEVRVQLEPISGRPAARLVVQDNDPEGFKYLSHGFTLFAESIKKGDATKRGRFNLGEKLVLAACEKATLSTTKGTVYFKNEGGVFSREEFLKEKLHAGSIFEAEILMTRSEAEEILEASKLLIPPDGVKTRINGQWLVAPTPLKTFSDVLPTEFADTEGYLRRTQRDTTIRIFAPLNGTAYLYEMGIPVVEIELPWSVDIGQKVPLNADRDNVTPAYRKTIGVMVLNAMYNRLTQEEASAPIVQEALTSPDVSVEAVNAVLTQQYGDQRVAFDPSDPESNQNAEAYGYAVIRGGAFSKAAWTNIRRAGAAQAAGKLFPTPKPYNPEGEPAKIIPEEQWTDGMREVERFCVLMAQHLMDIPITVVMEGELTQPYTANYGHRRLTFNVYRLGKKWFDLQGNFVAVVRLMIHEFGHQYAASHLDGEYHDAISMLSGKITRLALLRPDLFPKVA